MARHALFPKHSTRPDVAWPRLGMGILLGMAGASLQCRHGGACAFLDRVWPGWRRVSLGHALERRTHRHGTPSAALPPWPWRSPCRQCPVAPGTPGPRVQASSLEHGCPDHSAPGCHRQRHATCPSRPFSGCSLPVEPTLQSLSHPHFPSPTTPDGYAGR